MEKIKSILLSEQDGLPLSVLKIIPDNEPVALIAFAHGMAEHKERYIPVMEFLADKGFACIINDHRGHGESIKNKDDLGYFYENGDKAVVEDIHSIINHFKNEFPGKPIFLLGHSMGSLIARVYIKKYDSNINGLILSGSPGQNPAAGAGKILINAIKAFKGDRYISPLCDNLFTGSFNKGFDSNISKNLWLSYNENNVKNYDADELCGFSFKLNGYLSLVNLMLNTYSKKGWKVANKALPIWFISGAEDPCMIDVPKFIAAVDLIREVGYQNVSYKLYENMRHEIMNENDKEIVWNDIYETLTGWIK